MPFANSFGKSHDEGIVHASLSYAFTLPSPGRLECRGLCLARKRALEDLWERNANRS